MSVKSTMVAFCILAVGVSLSPAVALAQSPTPEGDQTTRPTKIFKLQHETTTAARDLELQGQEAEAWVPGLKKGTVEVSMALGFMNLGSTLLEHQQMIYKYTTEATYWGDVKLTGQSAFSPTLRIGYNLQHWLTLEGYGGLSISEYSSTVENRHSQKNEPGAPIVNDPPLGEFDAEARSLITLQAGIDAVVYPLDISGDGLGRWHPYVTGMVGRIWYDMNSDFTAGAAGSNDVALGAGLRLLADRNVSLRLEATYHLNSVQFEPAEYFLETDEGTTKVPLNEYPVDENGQINEQQITEFTSQDMNYMAWSIAFQGSF